MPVPCRTDQADLLHSSYYRKVAAPGLPTIQSCYDFTYERYRSGPARWVHSWQKRAALSSATGIICISESTRQDLLHYCPEVREEETCVTHLGYSSVFRQLSNDEAEGLLAQYVSPEASYVVFVGDRSAYKNFPIAVHAVARTFGHYLVIVGGGPLNPREFALLELLLPKRFIHIDKASSALLNALYNKAHALIYPSAYEGFGLPVIEAMAAGCPVIAVNASSIPEVAGSAGLLLDRPDADAAAEWLEHLEDSSVRVRVIADGILNANRFSWERCYQETMAFYARVLAR
jgi:mannosyltransferase